MRFARYSSALLTTAALALGTLTGCGSQGNPLPPSLELPKPVNDLKAARKGDKVRLTWTEPRETTDRLRIKEAGKTRICRSSAAPAPAECSQVGELAAGPVPASGAFAGYTDTLPRKLQEQEPTGFAVYTVEAVNARGRSAGLSNAVKVPLAPTLPPPAGLEARVVAEGVTLSFSAPATPPGLAPGERTHSLRIYRRTAGAAAETVVGELPLPAPPPSFLDTTIEWEKGYRYRITTVTKIAPPGGTPVEVEGDDSTVEVLAHDSFPPAAPTGVEAVATAGGGQSFIDLTWSLNSEADLAGYNIYRREEGGQAQKINGELLKTPAYRDASVGAGHTYLYSVSAVDLRANESGHSEEASEAVPQP